MIERRDARPPVTYTTFQARDLGGDTAELFKTAARDAYERFKPEAMLVGASCTAELIQDDPGGLAQALRPADPGRPARAARLSEERELGRGRDLLPAGARLCRTACAGAGLAASAARGFTRATLQPARRRPRSASAIATTSPRSPSCSASSASTSMSSPRSARRPPISRASARPTSTSCSTPRSPARRADWLARTFSQPCDQDRADRRRRHARLHRRGRRTRRRRCDSRCSASDRSRLPWYSRSVDSTYLTGKRVFIFGDATHAIAAARIATARARLHRRRPRHLQPRVRPRGARGRARPTASRR